MLSQFILIRNNMWVIAMALTLIYVSYGVGLLIKTSCDVKRARRIIAENRDLVFETWMSTEKKKGGNK